MLFRMNVEYFILFQYNIMLCVRLRQNIDAFKLCSHYFADQRVDRRVSKILHVSIRVYLGTHANDSFQSIQEVITDVNTELCVCPRKPIHTILCFNLT